MISGQTLFFALLGGILPALLWLWFWLKEDKKKPEPRGLILLAFVSGMITVPLVIPLEQAALYISGGAFTIVTIFLWSAIEELMKYGAGFLIVLRNKANDEPIDALVYMITIALGFAALENTLFLLNTIESGDIIGSINTGNLRFIGATVLHTLASAIVGGAMALSFYKVSRVKKLFLTVGIMLAIVLHAFFNFAIITSNGEKLLNIFIVVWAGVVLLILFFEKIKKLYNRDLIKFK